MSERHPIRNQVIGGVLTVAVLGVGAWLLGVAQPVLRWLIHGSVVVPGAVIVTTSFFVIAFATRALIGRRRLRAEQTPPPIAAASSRPGLELWPVSFKIDLDRPVPSVSIEFHAINHLQASLSLRHVVVSRLSFGSGLPALDGIPLANEIDLGSQSTRLVYCERPLADSEARAVREAAGRPVNGSLSVVARGVSLGQDVEYLASAIAVTGWVSGITP